MKLLRYSRKHETRGLSRLGVLMPGNLIGDLRAAYAMYLVDVNNNPKGRQLAEIYMPPYLVQFLHIGEPAWLALGDTYNYLSELVSSSPGITGLNNEQMFIPLEECRLYAPLRPSKLIAIGGNYPGFVKAAGRARGRAPAAFIKPLSSVVGPGRDIVKPSICRELDFEAELAIVIGKRCKNVTVADAYSVVAGYTILNDVTARDVGRSERETGQRFFGKAFDTFAPMGPWMVTRDTIPDPMNLSIRSRVNGEVRQEGNTREMYWSIPELIAYASQITLMPGDVIATGSPGGGGLSNPDWMLRAGDIVECEIEGIGTLANGVVDEPPMEGVR